MSAVCKTCHDPVVLVSRVNDPGPGVFEHDGGGVSDHKVEPKPLCDKCGSLNYAFYQTNWGHGWRCTDCGYDVYYSLGD